MDNKRLTSSFEQLVAKRAFALQKEKKNFEVFFGERYLFLYNLTHFWYIIIVYALSSENEIFITINYSQ